MSTGLRVITGGRARAEKVRDLRAVRRHRAWERVFLCAVADLVECTQAADLLGIRRAVVHLVTAGVHFLDGLDPRAVSREMLGHRLDQVHLVLLAMTTLTPRQLAQLFPDEKDFTGDPPNHTSSVLIQAYLGPDDPLDDVERVLEMLTVYDNRWLGAFMFRNVALSLRVVEDDPDPVVARQLSRPVDDPPRAKRGGTRRAPRRGWTVVHGGRDGSRNSKGD